MNLIDLLGSGAGQTAVGQIAQQLGIDERTANTAMRAVPSGGSGALGILSQVLDADGDGSPVDDLLNLAQRFF